MSWDSASVGPWYEMSDFSSTAPAKSGVVGEDSNESSGPPGTATNRHEVDTESLLERGLGFKASNEQRARFDQQVDFHDAEQQESDQGPTFSSYSEVRATVPNGDDPRMPINTLRVWLIGALLTSALTYIIFFLNFEGKYGGGSALNGAILVQPLAYLVGRLMAKIPYRNNWPGAWFINPGEFNVKEHTYVSYRHSTESTP